MRLPTCCFAGALPSLAVFCALVFTGGVASAQSQSAATAASSRQAQATSTGTFNTSSVESLLQQGDQAVAQNDPEKALKLYDDARSLAINLAGIYGDLSGSFRGLNAPIRQEMDANGRRAVELQARASLRLAAVYRQLNQPEVAVPLLTEVVRIMTPINPEGIEAYRQLVQLGFATTAYRTGQ